MAIFIRPRRHRRVSPPPHEAFEELVEHFKRGKDSEERFIALVRKWLAEGLLPPNVLGIERASKLSDIMGIDALVRTTNAGYLPIQIKSSETGRKTHMRRSNRRHIPCVVAGPERPEKEILQELLDILATREAT